MATPKPTVEEPSDAKPFVRVRDKRTKHEYDVHYKKLEHEVLGAELERVPDVQPANRARRAKPYVDTKTAAAVETKETSK